jgi:hypothetical protein
VGQPPNREANRMITPGRRPLTFASLAAVMDDVDRLLPAHTTVGRWSLGQVCNHLTGALIGSVDGFPGRAPWLLRKTVGRVVRRQIMKSGQMREGFKLPERFLPKPGLDARAEAEALRAALRMYDGHSGPLADHPLFGPLDRDAWTRLHCIHCAHHLSFVQPGGAGG